MACYLSFVATAAFAGLRTVRKTDLLFVESPPLFLGMTARLISAVRRCRYVFNVSDLWPDSAVEMGWVRDGLAVKLSRELEAWIYSGSLALTGQSRSIVEALQRRAPGKPVELLTNGVDFRRFDSSSADQAWRRMLPTRSNAAIAVYAGLHGVAQGLDQILDAAKRLQNSENILIVFIGDGPEKPTLLRLAREAGLENVVFQDSVPPERVPGILLAADLAVIPLGFDLTGAVPSKIYEAMAASLPIIFVGGGEGRDLIDKSGSGLCCDIGDIHGIAAALSRLADNPDLRRELGSRGRNLVKERFDRVAIAARLGALLEDASL